ncbi:MAG TPA: hypothetical protein VNL39_06415 [Xanthobacteraceae bacterium]|nr:hypothetical protein [Xanthobacteraceae bacterium]
MPALLRALRSTWRSALLATFLLTLGCANGDFGRLNRSLVTDDMHAWVAREAPERQGKPASQFRLTDAERQLRDLAYPLIEPPYDRQRWYSVLAEYGLVGAAQMPYPEPSAYADRLLSTPVRSQTALYAKLVEDIRQDVVRIDPFFAVARYVIDMDRKREASLEHFAAANRDQHEDARARIAENVAIIRWVQKSLGARAASYHYALSRLVVEAPSPMAVEAERSLTLLQSRIAVHRDVLNQQVAGLAPWFGPLEQGFGK